MQLYYAIYRIISKKIALNSPHLYNYQFLMQSLCSLKLDPRGGSFLMKSQFRNGSLKANSITDLVVFSCQLRAKSLGITRHSYFKINFTRMERSFLKKTFSLVLSLFLIACLISSAALSGIRVSSAASPNDGQGNSAGDFLYTVSANPPLLKIEEGKQGSFNIKVARGSDKGIFTVVLSLATNSPFLKAKQMMFSPPLLNFEQGQTFKNSTLILGDLPPATYKFKVKASGSFWDRSGPGLK